MTSLHLALTTTIQKQRLVRHRLIACVLCLIAFLASQGCGMPLVVVPTKSPHGSAPTPKVSSTLTAVDARERTLELLQTNGGCTLPCLWGLMPGSSSVQERQALLDVFGEVSMRDFRIGRSDYPEEGSGIRNMFFLENGLEILISLSYFERDDVLEFLTLSTRMRRDGEPVFESPLYQALLKPYLLPQILTQFGQPSTILIGAWNEDPFLKEQYTPFSLVVVYEQKGFMIEYISPATFADESIVGCTQNTVFTLWSWSPENDLSLEDIVARKSGDEGITPQTVDYFKSIDAVSTLSIDDFHQIFQNPDTTTCIETLQSYWLP